MARPRKFGRLERRAGDHARWEAERHFVSLVGELLQPAVIDLRESVLPAYKLLLDRLEPTRLERLAAEWAAVQRVEQDRPFGPEVRETFELRQRHGRVLAALEWEPRGPLGARVSWAASLGFDGAQRCLDLLQTWREKWHLELQLLDPAIVKTLENWVDGYDPLPGHLAPFGWNFLWQSGPSIPSPAPPVIAPPFEGAPRPPTIEEYRPTWESGQAHESALEAGAKGIVAALKKDGLRELQPWLEEQLRRLSEYLADCAQQGRLSLVAQERWLAKQRRVLEAYRAEVYSRGRAMGLSTVATKERRGDLDHVEWLFRQLVLGQKTFAISREVGRAEITIKKGLAEARALLFPRSE